MSGSRQYLKINILESGNVQNESGQKRKASALKTLAMLNTVCFSRWMGICRLLMVVENLFLLSPCFVVKRTCEGKHWRAE